MPAIPLIAAAAISAGTAAVQANQQRKAAQGAAAAQNTALNDVKGVDIPALQNQAKAADVQKYKDQFGLLNEVDPQTGAIRSASNAGLAGSINDTNTTNSNNLLQSLYGENVNLDPNDKAFSDQLKAEASRQLSLGGNLSPEQQAEFVRSGLENGAAGGFNAGSNALKQGVGQLLASQQEALGNSRRQMAQQLFGFATDLNTKRINNLTGIAGAGENASAAQFSKLFNLANLADSRTPNIGLGGTDVANLAVSNTNLDNNKALQKGGVAANLVTANGAANSKLIGSVGSSIGTLAGGLMKTYNVGGKI